MNAMRADLLSKGSHHQPIYVEPVEPYLSDTVSLQSTYGDLLKQYDRGRRFLERRQRSYCDGRSQIDMSERNLSFAKQTFDTRLLTEMAKEMNVSPALLKDDIKLASAVDTLVQNCNADVYGALFHGPHPQSRKAIMSLSRTSDLRQQHRIQGVLDRRFRSVAPQVNDDDFETVAYNEVPSRLRRARGGIEKLECMIEDSGEPDAPLHR
ncbi:MAG TPA: hypothetical protein DD473_21360 [Planctomycetaceae bacterium]|nr:hypothetical protein [Planctomycetaceae bacterium]